MPTAAEISILISAKNQAQGALDQVSKSVGALPAEVAKAQASLQGMGGAMEKAQAHGAGMVGALGKIGLAGAGLQTVVAGAQALGEALGVGVASDLAESMSKVNTVLGESSKQIAAFAATSATSFGISKAEAYATAGQFGNLFTTMGLGKDAAAGMAVDITKLGADLASFHNIAGSDALDKLRAGLVGEAEPLRAMGILLTEAGVKAKGMELGLADAKGELSEAAKVQARYALIVEQTGAAQGDFARTSTGLANSQRIIGAAFSDIQASIGDKLLPVLAPLVSKFAQELPGALAAAQPALAGVGDALSAVGDAAQAATSLMEANQGVMAVVAGVAGGLAAAWALMTAAQVAQAAATAAQTLATGALSAAQGLLNAVMSANPIGLVVVALAAAAAGLAYAYNNSEQFRQGVDAAWAAVQVAAGVVGKFASDTLGGLQSAFAGAMSVVSAFQTDFPGTLFKVAAGIVQAVASFHVEAAKLGQSVIEGIVKGIWDNAGKVIEAMKSMAGQALEAAKNALWAHSPSERAAQEIGEPIPDGVIVGAERRQGALNAAMSGMMTKALEGAATAVTAFRDLAGPAFAQMAATAEAEVLKVVTVLGGGAVPAFKEAQAALAALSVEMTAAGERLREQEGILKDYEAALKPLEKALSAARSKVTSLRDALADAQDALDGFAGAPLAGENAGNQVIFGLKNAIKILQFQRESLIQEGGKSKDDPEVKAIDERIKANQDRLRLEELRLSATYDGQHNALQQIAGVAKELTFAEALAGIVASKAEIEKINTEALPAALLEYAKLTTETEAQRAKIQEQKELIEGEGGLREQYQKLQEAAKLWVAELNDALSKAKAIRDALRDARSAGRDVAAAGGTAAAGVAANRAGAAGSGVTVQNATITVNAAGGDAGRSMVGALATLSRERVLSGAL